MLEPCEVTQMAAELRAQLYAQHIPDDYRPEGTYWEALLGVRRRFTNYDALLTALPDCPADCPFGAGAGRPTGPRCFNYDLAHDTLTTDATWLATHTFDTWCDRRTEAPARSMV